MQRFYGGEIDWLNDPYKIVEPYIVMLPILQAEEQLTRINNTAIGTGSMKEKDLRPIMRELKELAGSRKQKRQMNTEAKMIALSAMGMPCVDLRKKKT